MSIDDSFEDLEGDIQGNNSLGPSMAFPA